MLPMRTGAFGRAAGGASFSFDRRLADSCEGGGACNQVRENMSKKQTTLRGQSRDGGMWGMRAKGRKIRGMVAWSERAHVSGHVWSPKLMYAGMARFFVF
jgi:hypothetical protein